MTQADKVKFMFTMGLMTVTVVIMIGFIVYTVKVFRQIRREIREKKARLERAEPVEPNTRISSYAMSENVVAGEGESNNQKQVS